MSVWRHTALYLAAVLLATVGHMGRAGATTLIELNVSKAWPGRSAGAEENNKLLLSSGMPGIPAAVEKLNAVTAAPLPRIVFSRAAVVDAFPHQR